MVRRVTSLQGGGRWRRLSSLLDAMLIDEHVLLSVHTEQTSDALERHDTQPRWDRSTLVTMMEIQHEHGQHHWPRVHQHHKCRVYTCNYFKLLLLATKCFNMSYPYAGMVCLQYKNGWSIPERFRGEFLTMGQIQIYLPSFLYKYKTQLKRANRQP